MFAALQCLPRNGQAITTWDNEDTAWTEVTEGIRRVLDEVSLSGVGTPSPRVADPRIWNIPFARNPFFTGRDELLEQLHAQLQTTQAAAVSQHQAISGLGGIGKTQVAVEYAYRYGGEYQAVLWARAESTKTLNGSYMEIAGLLRLPQREAKEQEVIVQAVKGWLSSKSGWLLILDNADQLAIVPPFLPTRFSGHLLLTTRAQAIGKLAERFEVKIMSEDVGALLLLRRARLIARDALLEDARPSDRAVATQITRELDGLPLALDQVGAYIEETECGLAGYQRLYQTRRMELLQARGGITADDHPEPVATTWSLSFEQVEKRNPAAADLLRFCAFLAPDAIPEEILSEGTEALGETLVPVAADPFLLNGAIESLWAYSLMSRDAEAQMLSVHRLVQAVVRDRMRVEAQQQWMQRALRAINVTFPGDVELKNWPICDRLLPHALVCATWIEHEPIPTLETSHLLHKAGTYLRERAQYSEAEPLLVRAVAIRERYLGAEHLDTVMSLDKLAGLYWYQGKYSEAEPLYQRVLTIREQYLGAEHPDTARSLNGLALIYWQQGKYSEAEPLYQRALAILEQQLGAEHPETGRSLYGLAVLYRDQKKYEQAEPLYQRALAISERHLGNEHPETGRSLYGLASFYRDQGKYEQAEPLYQRAIAILERHLGTEHPDIAQSLYGLAEIYHHQGKYSEAEPLYQRALTILEQQLGIEHPHTAYPLHGLAELYQAQGKYSQAEPLYQRALTIREHTLGPDHPNTQLVRDHYAALLEAMKEE